MIISADEYLNSGYHPDMEYVEGILVERSVPTVAHSLMQLILCVYLDACRKQSGFEALPEARTQIVERARYRIPDVMLCPVPLPTGKIVNSVPWAVIEILSPEDRLPEQLARFRDYKQIGVRHMVLLDPEELTAYRFENRALIETQLTSLELPTGDLPFDTETLFRQLVERRNQDATVAPAIPLVSADEYLNSGYHPDMEYVEGVLVERDAPTIAHSLLQLILGEYFRRYRKQFRFAALSETRTQIVERARYRIQDLMLCPVPLPPGKIVNSTPWAVIEILSPDDRLSEQLARFRDYKQIGVRQMVLLDPEEFIAYRFDENGSLLQTQFTSLDLPSGSLPFDSEALFRQLVEERNEGVTLS